MAGPQFNVVRRVPSGSVKQYIKYYIFAEGMTENRYMTGVKENADVLKIRNPNLKIEPILRPRHMANRAEPRENLDYLLIYKEALKRPNKDLIGVPVGFFVPAVMGTMAKKMTSLNKSQMNELQRIQESLVADISNHPEFASQGPNSEKVITDPTEALNYIVDKIKQEPFYGTSLYQSLELPQIPQGYNEESDKFCLIVDRDKHPVYRNKAYYDKLVNDCKDSGINLYVSTPDFEFWLLLHYMKAADMPSLLITHLRNFDKKWINENDSEKYSLVELKKLIKKKYDADYSKSGLDFKGWFLKNVDQAIANAYETEMNLKELESNLGSNVGTLIEELRHIGFPE